jgi:KDO2-lipid IV(A) lauroyltransferase
MRKRASKVKARKQQRRRGEVPVRDRAEYVAMRMLAGLLRALPVATGAALMGKAWRLVGPFTSRHRRALRNIDLAFPGLDPTERKRIAAEQWDNLGRTFAESFVIDRLVAKAETMELDISPELDRRLRAPGGFIGASMHSANWEIGALPMRRYRSLGGLYQQLSNPLSDAYVARLRRNVFDGALFTKGLKTPGLVMQWLRDGNAVGLLTDGREARGITVTAFGRPTLANPFPAMAARRLGIPLLAGRAIRLPGSRFRLQVVEIPVPVSDDAKADVAAATQAITDQLDAWIRERPGEWMWVQDRWRQGDGKPQRRQGSG